MGEISRVNYRDPILRDLPDDFPVTFLPMAAVDADTGTIVEPQERPISEVRKGFTSFSEGNVLFAKITPSMENGKATIAKGLKNGRGFGSTEFHVLSPNEGILPEWIFYFIRQESFRGDAKANFTGTAGQLRVPSDFLKDYPFPLPPLAEQQRIVDEIEAQFTRLDAVVAALKRARANLKRYRASVLKTACEGRLVPQDPSDEPAGQLLERILAERRQQWNSRGPYTEPTPPDTSDIPELPVGWVWASVEQVTVTQQYGTSDKATTEPVGIPVLRMSNIQEGELDFTNLKYMPADWLDIEKFLLQPGDVLFNRTNSAELVGKSAVYRSFHPKAVAASYLIRVQLVENYLPNFLVFYINSVFGRNYINSVVTQQVGQANVNGTKLSRMPVPLPPLAEQQRIVEEVERRLSVMDEVEAALAANLKRAERLRQAILKRAFEGKLVPQNPADEPVSVLLERIRVARGNAQRSRQLGLPGI